MSGEVTRHSKRKQPLAVGPFHHAHPDPTLVSLVSHAPLSPPTTHCDRRTGPRRTPSCPQHSSPLFFVALPRLLLLLPQPNHHGCHQTISPTREAAPKKTSARAPVRPVLGAAALLFGGRRGLSRGRSRPQPGQGSFPAVPATTPGHHHKALHVRGPGRGVCAARPGQREQRGRWGQGPGQDARDEGDDAIALFARQAPRYACCASMEMGWAPILLTPHTSHTRIHTLKNSG